MTQQEPPSTREPGTREPSTRQLSREEPHSQRTDLPASANVCDDLGQDRWSEGRDGSNPLYQERLWPGPAVWLACLMLVSALAVAYAKALGLVAGLILGIGGLVLVAATIAATVPVVRVDSRVLRAGRARLPLHVTGAVIVADRAATAVARGPQGDPSAHMVIAIGVNQAIVVEVCDPADPHRTWLVSSRRPQDLARAVRAARGKVAS